MCVCACVRASVCGFKAINSKQRAMLLRIVLYTFLLRVGVASAEGIRASHGPLARSPPTEHDGALKVALDYCVTVTVIVTVKVAVTVTMTVTVIVIVTVTV